VAAEFAVTLPALLLVIGLGVATLGAGAQGIRLQDAAADAARLIARGEDRDRAHDVATEAGADAFAITEADDLVCVQLGATVRLGALAVDAWRLGARSCALAGGW